MICASIVSVDKIMAFDSTQRKHLSVRRGKEV